MTMSLPHLMNRFLVAPAIVLAVSISALAPAAGADEEPEQLLSAPFSCGTEWWGTTRSGHGENNLSLDLNRTDLVWPDPLHDLGQPILAQADGTVVWVGWHDRAGTYVEVDYGDTTVVYVHLVDGSPTIEVGDHVVLGQQLAELGNTGNVSGSPGLAHLHLAYFDSSGSETPQRSYLLKGRQIPITMDGVEMTAPIGGRSPVFTSTNCGGAVLYPFNDVAIDSFARDHITQLFELGITTGTGHREYSPDTPVDREQMAAFLARIWRLLAPETPTPEGDYPFDDVEPSSFAYDDIHLIFELGITTGTGPNTYSPADEVSREQMAAFLNRLHDHLDPPVAASSPNPEPAPDPGTYPFADVPPASFAYDDIADIHGLGITTGTSNSTYSPADTVDREQMAAFLARVYRLLAPAG